MGPGSCMFVGTCEIVDAISGTTEGFPNFNSFSVRSSRPRNNVNIKERIVEIAYTPRHCEWLTFDFTQCPSMWWYRHKGVPAHSIAPLSRNLSRAATFNLSNSAPCNSHNSTPICSHVSPSPATRLFSHMFSAWFTIDPQILLPIRLLHTPNNLVCSLLSTVPSRPSDI